MQLGEKPNTAARVCDSAPAKKSFASRFRTGLFAVTLVAALYTSYGFGKLIAEWRESSPTVPAPVRADWNSMPATLPVAGHWSFAGLDWDLTSSSIAVDQISAEFEKAAAPPSSPLTDQLPDISEELANVSQLTQLTPIERDGNKIYRLDRPDMKGQMVVKNSGGRQLVISAVAAIPQNAGNWQLMKLSPRPAGMSVEKLAAHLLPLPANASRCGGRFAENGSLLLELDSLETNASSLLSEWRAAGWEVHATGLGGPDSFSYFCARGNDTIYAWSADDSTSLHSVMLVRNPGSEDTKSNL